MKSEDGTGGRRPLLGDVGIVTPPYFDLQGNGKPFLFLCPDGKNHSIQTADNSVFHVIYFGTD